MQPKVSSAAYDFLTLLMYFECGEQTTWIQIRLLQKEQSDLGLRCLVMRLLQTRKTDNIFVVIGALRVNSDNA